MSNVTSRIEKLEAASNSGGHPIFIWIPPGESEDSAVARWIAQSDDGQDPRLTRRRVCFIRWKDPT